jgi:FkbM family methyltransferase
MESVISEEGSYKGFELESIPNRLKIYLIAMQINAVSRLFLKSRSYSIIDFFAGGGRKILRGTALFPEKGFHVADVGAYRGWFTAISSKIVGSGGRIYSFEPEPSNFEYLRKVCLLGRLKNVLCFRLAISDNDGFDLLYLSKNPSMHSLVLRRGYRKITVPCRKLDTMAKLIKFPKLDLIKIDVEGAELKVLRGCRSVVNQFEPIFSIDVNHYDGEYKEVSALMRELGYEITPCFGRANRPFSIVAYPRAKRDLAKYLINKTKKLALHAILRKAKLYI